MANRWGIPCDTEDIVRKRDLKCVYCGIEFNYLSNSKKAKPTWEHIINDIRLNGLDNIAICCSSCNASKGSRKLEDWLQSKYCISKCISVETVAPVIKNYLDKVKYNNDIKACP